MKWKKSSSPIAFNSCLSNIADTGGERLAELVFADDALAYVWVLIDAGESAAMRSAMEAQFGAPTHDTEMFTAFADNHAALRYDPPEFLYYGAHVAPMYRDWFDQMSGN